MRAVVLRRRERTASQSRDAIATAIIETIVHLGVYRTYVVEAGGTAHATGDDARWVDAAIAGARATADGPLLDLLREVLLLGGLDAFPEEERVDRLRFDSNVLDLTPLGRQEAWEQAIEA